MTTAVEPAGPAALRRDRRRALRRAFIALALVLVAAGLTAVFTLRHLDHQYGPVRAGAFWGPQSERGLAVSKDGFSYRLATSPDSSARFIACLENAGAHSVEVTSIDNAFATTNIQWSAYRVVPGGYVSGVSTPWQAFPATVPAGATIRLLITIHRPDDCLAYQKYQGMSTATYSGEHLVHWNSLLHSHTTWVDFTPAEDRIPVC